MLRLMLLVAALVFAPPALAQQLLLPSLKLPRGQVRSFSLQNRSGRVITAAMARMTDGKNRVLTYAPVPPKQVRLVVVPRDECVDSVTVHLNDGQILQAKHLNDCKSTVLLVGKTGVNMTSGPTLRPGLANG